MAKWTKKELRVLKDAWMGGALEYTGGRDDAASLDARDFLATDKSAAKKLILHWLRTLFEVQENYMRKDSEFGDYLSTAEGHNVYPPDRCPDIRARFAAGVEEHRKKADWYWKLYRKVVNTPDLPFQEMNDE